MNISEFRKKYPQYASKSNKELLEAIHEKYYSKMSFDLFVKMMSKGDKKESAPEDSDRHTKTLVSEVQKLSQNALYERMANSESQKTLVSEVQKLSQSAQGNMLASLKIMESAISEIEKAISKEIIVKLPERKAEKRAYIFEVMDASGRLKYKINAEEK